MTSAFEQRIRSVMDGSAHDAGASALRAALATAEPFYSGAMRARNLCFDLGLRPVRRLARPVISVGNITTGGTGKTPLVFWMADQLRLRGRGVGIVSRGYKSRGSGVGDELTMLDATLNQAGAAPVRLAANPNRYEAGRSLLAEHPETDVLILDDGFQRRQLARDLDVVLVSAAEPFGFGHVLPRGMLREPMSGLRRAGAIVITHADLATEAELADVESRIRRQSAAPIYRCVHGQSGIVELGGFAGGPGRPMSDLESRRFFAFCGIGNPAAFDRQLSQFARTYAGRRWFADHHAYCAEDLQAVCREAKAAGADVLVTTQKDAVKIAALPREAGTPEIWCVQMRLAFLGDDERRLLDQLSGVVVAPETSKRADP